PEPVSAPAEAGEAPVSLSDGALPSPASWRAGRRPVPALRQDLEGLGETLFAFMRDESSAVLTHLNALKDARSPADAIRLQVNEMQRAADASLTCWSELARRATRMVAQR
ncbi:Phasin, partial [Methylobacterium sp. WL12]